MIVVNGSVCESALHESDDDPPSERKQINQLSYYFYDAAVAETGYADLEPLSRGRLFLVRTPTARRLPVIQSRHKLLFVVAVFISELH